MKKIVFTVTNDLTYDQRMKRICTSLAAVGYNVTLVGFLKKRSVKTDAKTFRQIRLPVFFKRGKLFFLEYNCKLFFWLLFRRFDMYCGIDLDTLLPVFFNAKIKGKPCVYDAHEYYCELPEIVERPLIRKIWLAVENFLLPHIKYNYTVCNSIAAVLSEKYQQAYWVIRNVPMLNEQETAVEKENFVIYQGALNKGRGIEELMIAMQHIDATLYIAGEGDLSQQLRMFAGTLGHKNRIRFLGYVRPEALKQYTLKSKIGVNLVQNLGLSYYYSLSNKFFDYIHAEIPQVTMNFPEYRTLNEMYPVAVLIDDLYPATIAQAINKLLHDQQLYDQLKNNCAQARLALNWQEEEKKLLEFYRHVR